MERIRSHESRMTCSLLVVALCLLLTQASAGAITLDSAQTDGYLQWHHSLEQTTMARLAAEAQEGNLLFPFDLPGWEQTEVKPYRHLAIAKAIMELEAQWLLRGENNEGSSLVALAHARNYTNLSEYDSAMVWYQAAAHRDTLGLFGREIGRERLAVTIAAGDSLGISQLITNVLGNPDLSGRQQEIILAYRWLLAGRDSETLALLLDKVESQPEVMTDQIVFWHAYSQNWLDRKGGSLENLLTLVRSGGLSKDLTEGQRSWVLLAIPDLLFLMGDTDQAATLYNTLKDSSLDLVRTWSVYQLANIDFLASRFDKAANGFDETCEARRLGTWQDQACSMATIAREIARIQTEGEPYGTAQFYNQ